MTTNWISRSCFIFFQYWLEQRVFLDAVQNNDFDHLLLDRTTAIVDRMKANRPPQSFARDQVEYFVAHGLMTTVLRWHHHGFQSPPEEMAAVFGQLLRSDSLSFTQLLL